MVTVVINSSKYMYTVQGKFMSQTQTNLGAQQRLVLGSAVSVKAEG